MQGEGQEQSHRKETFLREQKKKKIVTMDQPTVAELNQPFGISGFKYGIVFLKVDTDYWWFVPLRTLKFTEAFYRFAILQRYRC